MSANARSLPVFTVLLVTLGVIIAGLGASQRTAVPREPMTAPALPPAPTAEPLQRKPPVTKAPEQTPTRKPPEEAEKTAQRRPPAPPPPAAHPRIAMRGELVFIGGYFYDPYFGPYPWWPRVYRPWYYPDYDYRAEIRLRVTPKEAAVYVDGYYAGIVDDFDGMFQKLLVPPGGHSVSTFREGFRTVHHNLYLHPGSDMALRYTMEPLPLGQPSEPPVVMVPVAAPPEGSYRLPRTPPSLPSIPSTVTPPAPADAEGFGTLELRVQPTDAEVAIDGERWATSDPGHLAIDVSDGRHRVQVSRRGYMPYARDIDVVEGKTTTVNVSLPVEHR